MSTEKKIGEELTSKPVPVEIFVGQELGSTGAIQALDKNDSRQNTRINEAEALALAYFEQIPYLEGGDYAMDICESYRRHKMSVGGWRAEQLIRLVEGSKGVKAGKVIRPPGLFGRLVTNRNFREKAQLEGATIIE